MKKIIAILLVIGMMLILPGCVSCMTEAEKVNYNISKEADLFNVTRRIAVINARTDKPLFEMVGNFSVSNNSSRELVITVEVEPGQYKKHYIYLNEYTMYVVEDVSGAYIDPYHYEVNFLPEMIIPITFTTNE